LKSGTVFVCIASRAGSGFGLLPAKQQSSRLRIRCKPAGQSV